MNQSKVFLFILSLVFSMSQSGVSFARDHGDSFLRVRSDRSEEVNPEVLSAEGIVRCKGGCSADGAGCELQFVRASDGEVFDLNESPELQKLHCSDHKRDLQVKLEAEINPRFLFWGGDLVVKKFDVVGEIPAQICLVQPEQTASEWPNRSFGRGDLK